jgi:hypothetical protein
MPMRHGLTLGELGHWFIDKMKLDVDYRVIEMEGYEPEAAPGHGWPLTSGSGSIRAQMPQTSGWPALMPER